MKPIYIFIISIALTVLIGYNILELYNDIGVKNTPSPPIYVPKCSNGYSEELVLVNSNGLKEPTPVKTLFKLCHTNFQDLAIIFNNTDYYIKNTYQNCNDPLYKQDVVEIFLSNPQNDPLHKYIELEVSPSGILFASSIYNDGHSFTGTPINCDSSGVKTQTIVNKDKNNWIAQANIPFNLFLGQNFKYNQNQIKALGNFYRIDLTSGDQCYGTENCSYLSYSPTYANPPNFHKPLYFVEIIFQ